MARRRRYDRKDSTLVFLLNQAMVQSGLTKQEFAAQAGVSERHLRRLRQGEHPADPILEILRNVGWTIEEEISVVPPEGVRLPLLQNA